MQRSAVFIAVFAAHTVLAADGGHTLPWLYYDYNNRGPSTWASLDPDFATCSSGTKQSPVDFDHIERNSNLKRLQFHYGKSTAGNCKIVNLQKAIQVKFDVSPGYFVDPTENQRYDIVQIHFHSPSEHGIGGGRFPLEMHIVHTAADPSNPHPLAVVGMFFKIGDHNERLNAMWRSLPGLPMPAFDHYANQSKQYEYTEASTESDLELVVAGDAYYTYSGSLTTPPCAEGVKWFVMEQPAPASPAQIDAFRAAMGFEAEKHFVEALGVAVPSYSIVGNSRPYQPLRGRKVQLFAGEATTTIVHKKSNNDDDDWQKIALAALIAACFAVLVAVVAAAVAWSSSRPQATPMYENAEPAHSPRDAMV